jgi:hypothetical protein
MFGRLNGAARDSIEVSLDVLAHIITLARSVGGAEPGANGTESEKSTAGQSGAGAQRDLRAGIDSLPDDDKAVLTALAWIGRGDFSPAEFDEALSLAFERGTRSAGDYLAGLPALADLLERGAEACGADFLGQPN